ncbi:glycosyltransferase family 4 protein [Roseibacillus persicicus]|uniref:glycosyltransferase family 4 protein n=1 Tax=Roseibacillus persicicus TaxID=454148 RepID=UPI00398B5E12
MKPNVLISFDGHTPYLAFRVKSLQEEIEKRGLSDQIRMRVLLSANTDSNYNWEAEDLNAEYGGVPVTILMDKFHGLGFRPYFTALGFKTAWKTFCNVLSNRPQIAFVGGYDRPSCLVIGLLGRLLFFKTGVMHDSRFNDAESYSKTFSMETLKAITVRIYHFFMCSGQECVDYTRFLAGKKKPALIKGWNMLDNEALAKSGDDSSFDAEIRETFQLQEGERYFFLPSRFIAKKNIPRVIEAYQMAQSRSENFPKLIIAGRGPLREQVEARIAELNLGTRITLIDWLPYQQIPRAARLSESLILASTDDQWGLIINEALAGGSAVLVSNRAGAHELVENYVNGFTFDPLNTEHLSKLLYEIGNNPGLVDRLRSEARGSMESFSKEQFIEAWFEIFDRYHLTK